MAAAYRAGVALKDMEFVQYHPTGLPGTGILITEASRGEGGWLKNKDGYRYLQDYGLGPPTDKPTHRKMELGPRDILSRCHMQEYAKGRTFDGPYGHYVHLDLRHLGEEMINKKLPFVRELASKYVGIDPVYEPIPVRPVVHYMMGGISTDINAKTTLEGLYAAGETACVSLNGGNRLGSNSLTELLVFGTRAGRAAAAYATSASAPAPGCSRPWRHDRQWPRPTKASLATRCANTCCRHAPPGLSPRPSTATCPQDRIRTQAPTAISRSVCWPEMRCGRGARCARRRMCSAP